jgi:hypothetical protein
LTQPDFDFLQPGIFGSARTQFVPGEDAAHGKLSVFNRAQKFQSVPIEGSRSKRRKTPHNDRGPRGTPVKTAAAWTSPLVFLERHALVLVLAFLVVGSARIITTYDVFSHTWDEPGHIAGGIEWLTKGTYQFDQQHPPLTRIAFGLLPAFIGVQPPGPTQPGDDWMFIESRKILYDSNQYQRALFWALMGNLPFFWIGCLVVFLWGKRYFGLGAGVFALFLFSFLPPVLAHSGLATTDLGCTAMLGAAFLTACILIEEPSRSHAAVFGVCGGLAILSKFSVLAFFPASIAVALIWYGAVARPRMYQILQAGKTLAPLLAISAAVAFLIVWAGYRFSFGHGMPAPALWDGIREVARHNTRGHPGYLMGRTGRYGFWSFFPVAIAVKTPLAFLGLACAGIWLAIRSPLRGRAFLPAAYAVAILVVGMGSQINIGLRHILPIYIGLSVLGGAAAMQVWNAVPSKWAQAAVVLLVLWLAASSVWSHPDYLAYFNELGGSQPERILVDSDLDWGQDVARLGMRLQALGARQVTFRPGDPIDFTKQPGFGGIAVNETLNWQSPAPGWNAVGLTFLKQGRLGLYDTHPELALWPDVIPPLERVGKSILLWYFRPGDRIPILRFGSGRDASQSERQ